MLSRQLEFRIFKGFWIELEDKSSGFLSLVKYLTIYMPPDLYRFWPK